MAETYGDLLAQALAKRIHSAVATETAMAAIPLKMCDDGMSVVCKTQRSVWFYDGSSTDTADQNTKVPSDGRSTGRWRRLIPLSGQEQFHVDVPTGILAAGTPLAAFADNASSQPGITLANSKAKAVRWNNNATQVAVWYSVPMPQNLDDAKDLVVHFLVSKSGATLADVTKITFSGFFQTVGALHDADSDVGGDTGAVTGDATAKTVSELTYTIAAADVPPSPSVLSFSIKPKDGTLGTDDFLCMGIWFEFVPALLTT